MLIQGDARALPLADESVQCVVTSPPYWGLRDYGVDGQLGLEPTPEEYVAHMVEVFREVWRVLRPDGTLWLNLGDSYANDGKWGGETGGKQVYLPGADRRRDGRSKRLTGLKPKDMVGIPWRVAFALQANGWWLRSDIVWAKPNPMPENVTDRPTKAHEYLFLLTKSARYFYDAAAIRESVTGNAHARGDGVNPKARANAPGEGVKQNASFSAAINELVSSRNARTVWTIATQPYPGAHFATYPEKLVEPCIKAGSSPKACGVCAAPWERVVGEAQPVEGRSSGNKERQVADATSERGRLNTHMGSGFPWSPTATPTTGWRSTCAHDDDSGSSVVLDPFNGSGTTGRVAIRLGRSYVGVDISREYLSEQATRRMTDIQLGLEAAGL